MNRHLSEKQVKIRAVSVLFIITCNLQLSEILDNRLIFRLLVKLLRMLIYAGSAFSRHRAINDFLQISVVNWTKIDD